MNLNEARKIVVEDQRALAGNCGKTDWELLEEARSRLWDKWEEIGDGPSNGDSKFDARSPGRYEAYRLVMGATDRELLGL